MSFQGAAQSRPLFIYTKYWYYIAKNIKFNYLTFNYLFSFTNSFMTRYLLGIFLVFLLTTGCNSAFRANSTFIRVSPPVAKYLQHKEVVIHNNWDNRTLVAASLVDINGKVVREFAINGNHNVYELNVPTGIYVVRMQFNDGVGSSKLMVD